MIRVMQGDCRNVLPTLAAGSVQCVVTSPPYFGLRDYNVAGQIGLEATPDAFIAELVAVFRLVCRVLRDDGTLWLNLGDSYSSGNSGQRVRDTNGGFRDGLDSRTQGATSANPGRAPIEGAKPKDLLMMPARVALALQADGWWLRSDIIWAKLNPMPESVTDRPTSAHEHVFLLTKAERYFWDAEAVREDALDRTSGNLERIPRADRGGNPDHPGGQCGHIPYVSNGGRNIRNVWTIATAPYAEAHFATFPPALAERCIRAGTSERGACPHCGAPWGRVTERVDTGRTQKMADGWDTGAGAHGTIHRDGREAGASGAPVLATITTGWRQTCVCPDAAPVPCVVLDPFAGAFTAPLVADRLQRHAIGIELSAAYCTMARNRLLDDAGMFAEVAD